MHSWPHHRAVRALCATTCSWGATLATVFAAPSLLRNRPSCQPICVTCIAIVWQRGGLATACCWWASLPMSLATPSLLSNRPSCDPIGETIRAIVWICWPHWQHWLDRQYWHHWLDRQYWHHNWGYGGHLCGTALVVDSAAPTLLFWCPSGLRIYGAIERVAGWHWTGWLHRWGWAWPVRLHRWCGERRWWHSDRECLRASCCRPCGATPATCGAAKVLLLH